MFRFFSKRSHHPVLAIRVFRPEKILEGFIDIFLQTNAIVYPPVFQHGTGNFLPKIGGSFKQQHPSTPGLTKDTKGLASVPLRFSLSPQSALYVSPAFPS